MSILDDAYLSRHMKEVPQPLTNLRVKPLPDSTEWWQEIAQGLGVTIHDLKAQRDLLRAALVALVGADGREELEAMEAVLRIAPAPMEDKAAAIDGIQALISTLPQQPPAGGEK